MASAPPAALRGVIFDMDGVLCDSEPFIIEAGRKLFHDRFGVAVSAEDFRPFTGTGEDRFIGGVAEKVGVRLEIPADKHRLYENYLKIITGRMHPLAGARAFIADCQARGLALAVASSADDMKLQGNLAQLAFAPGSFAAVVSGSQVAHKKPDPEIFLLAAKKIGLAGGDCLVIEDAPAGLRAGRAAGARCLGITTSFDEATLRAAGAQFIAPDLARLPLDLLGLLFQEAHR